MAITHCVRLLRMRTYGIGLGLGFLPQIILKKSEYLNKTRAVFSNEEIWGMNDTRVQEAVYRVLPKKE